VFVGERVRAEDTATHAAVQESVAVYDGRWHVGFVAPAVAGQWLAETSAGHSLGLFTSVKAAIAAIVEAAREGQS